MSSLTTSSSSTSAVKLATSDRKEFQPDLPSQRINTFARKYRFDILLEWCHPWAAGTGWLWHLHQGKGTRSLPQYYDCPPSVWLHMKRSCQSAHCPASKPVEVDASHHWRCHHWPPPPPPRSPPVMGRSSRQTSLPYGLTHSPRSMASRSRQCSPVPCVHSLQPCSQSYQLAHSPASSQLGRCFSLLVLSSLTTCSEVATSDGKEFQPDLHSLWINTFARKYRFDIFQERCHPWAAGTGRLWHLHQGKDTRSLPQYYDILPVLGYT